MAYVTVWVHRRWSKRHKRQAYSLRWRAGGKLRQETPEGRAKFCRKDVEALAAQREHELNAGTYRKTTDVSFEEFCREDLELLAHKRAPATLKSLRQTYEAFARLSDVSGALSLAAITGLVVEKFYGQRLAEVSPSTAKKDMRTLQAALNRAIARSYLKDNPVVGIALKEPVQKKIRVLSIDEVERLRRACPDLQWRVLIEIALTAGLRREELLNLRWGDIDLGTRAILVRCRADWTPKTRRERMVFMSQAAAVYLRNLKKFRGAAATPEAYIFLTRIGTRMHNNVPKKFAGIVNDAKIGHCSLHTLRATCASWLAMGGVNEALVQKHLGHTQINTTLKHYTNVLASKLKDLPNSLPYVRPTTPPDDR